MRYLLCVWDNQPLKEIRLDLNYWPLFIAVLIGGQIGSFLNIKILSNKVLAVMTSFLVIFVAMRIGFRLIT